jgi:hypothetical protein
MCLNGLLEERMSKFVQSLTIGKEKRWINIYLANQLKELVSATICKLILVNKLPLITLSNSWSQSDTSTNLGWMVIGGTRQISRLLEMLVVTKTTWLS